MGKQGQGFPPWLRALRGKCGVYVIRERSWGGAWEVVYVGESHSGRLYKTLTRHLQSWSGRGSGPTYQREEVEIACRVTRTGKDALRIEENLICELNPRDNEKNPCEDVPF